MRWRRSHRTSDQDLAHVDAIISENVTIASRLEAETATQLAALAVHLIASKRWEAVDDLELTDEILVTVAANACVPILGLDLALYRQVRSIIVHAGANTSRGRRAGPVAGVFTDNEIPIIGQASPQSGPVSISWDAARSDSRNPLRGRNVVIHEFAHKIDMSDGYSDGTPPVRGDALDRWMAILEDEYERVDPRPSDDVLRPYAWTSPAEFFAVTSEAFFCTPIALREAKPTLYQALADFYRQHPAAWPGGEPT